MSNIDIDKQALREVAERATKGPWTLFSDIDTKTFSIHTPRDKRCENVIKWGGFDCQPNAEANAEFIAAFNPKVVLALLDELEAAESQNGYLREQRDEWERKAISNFEECVEMAARIEELEAQRKLAFTASNRWSDKFREAERRIAELEARTVNLPKLSVGEVMHMSEFSRDYAEGWCAGNDNAIHEIRAAGIKVKGE
ncbi:TPA: ead/Ea22-like family protein [Salmonella enterica subsp. enterica serovar Muenchen]|nr:ead/Ea22-like family protein [Salmonella enterica]HAV0154941.1 ead/Ea22-like family protein [Salmonella enterica]